MVLMNALLNRVAGLPAALVAAALFILCIVFVLPRQKASVAVYTHASGSLGLSFFPAPDTAYKMVEAYGPDGRKAYAQALLTYDFAWPLVYAFFYLVFINLTLGYAHGAEAARLRAAALPPLLLDWLENILAILILWAYPAKIDSAAWAMAAATCLKWITMGGASLLFGYGLVAALVRLVCTKIKNAHRLRAKP